MLFLTRHRRLLGYICIGISLALLASLIYEYSAQKRMSLSFSTATLLTSLWDDYTKVYVEPTTGRTIDPSQNNVTTSEGESYTMLRAVWIGDKVTFDRSWAWTEANLARPTDALFSWRYGELPNGTYGILTATGGNNTASDADSDIALALVMAASRWQDPSYLIAARAIIADIWNREVVTIRGVPYLAADNLEKTSKAPTILVNPSYLAPYSYRIFAEVDPTHPWNTLVTSSYALIGASMSSLLGASTSAQLPPDWVTVNRTTGALAAPVAAGLTTNFGYDALRTPWRLALDWQWNADPRDKQLLEQMQFLSTTYANTGRLLATYRHDGSTVVDASGTDPYDYESASMYGATIGYFSVADPSEAPEVYRDKLLYLFDADTNDWRQRLSYYDDNWAWFGLALYAQALPNLAASLTQTELAPASITP